MSSLRITYIIYFNTCYYLFSIILLAQQWNDFGEHLNVFPKSSNFLGMVSLFSSVSIHFTLIVLLHFLHFNDSSIYFYDSGKFFLQAPWVVIEVDILNYFKILFSHLCFHIHNIFACFLIMAPIFQKIWGKVNCVSVYLRINFTSFFILCTTHKL